MLKITLITIGKITQNSPEGSILANYLKLIKSKTTLFELELKNPPRDIKTLMEKEADLIIAKIPKNSYSILLDVEGSQYTSEEFTRILTKATNICFIIGGAYGAAPKIKEMVQAKLSLSKMTFTHIFARILILEQIYRAELIMSNHPYHK